MLINVLINNWIVAKRLAPGAFKIRSKVWDWWVGSIQDPWYRRLYQSHTLDLILKAPGARRTAAIQLLIKDNCWQELHLNSPAKIWTGMCRALLCGDDSSHSQSQSGKRLLLASKGHPMRTLLYHGSCIDPTHQSHTLDLTLEAPILRLFVAIQLLIKDINFCSGIELNSESVILL